MTHSLLIVVALLVSTTAVAGDLQTLAGNGATKNNGDMGMATQIAIKDTFGVETGPDGAIYVTEVGHHRIRRVDLTNGTISTVVGTGTKGYSGDGGPATKANLNEPYEVRFDRAGNMYFVEMQNHIIRRVDARTGVISTVAGNGQPGFGGDGGPAIKASFRRPHSIALDNDGNLYVADIGNHRIRRIHLRSNRIETIAGNGEKQLPVAGSAAGKPMLGPRALYVTSDILWIALREGNSVWKMNLKSGSLEHVAGSGQKGSRDGSPGVASFNGPKGIVVDDDKNAYVVDTENHVIRRIDGKTRGVTTIAGDGNPGAGETQMNRPHGICVNKDGWLFVGDTLNHRVVRFRASGN